MTAYRYIYSKTQLDSLKKSQPIKPDGAQDDYESFLKSSMIKADITEEDFENVEFEPKDLLCLVKKRWVCKYRLHSQYELSK
jgi:hypothetical protein